jgi:hypothetical protein
MVHHESLADRLIGAKIEGLSYGQKLSGTKVEYSVRPDHVGNWGGPPMPPIYVHTIPVEMEVHQNIPGGQAMLMDESVELIPMDPDDITPGTSTCGDPRFMCYRTTESLSGWFRFSAAAYADQNPIEIQTIVRYLPARGYLIDENNMFWYIVDRPASGSGIESVFATFDHTFSDNPPIAWNKVQTIGTEVDTDGIHDSATAENSTKLTAVAGGISGTTGLFETHVIDPGSPANTVTKSEFLNGVRSNTVLWGDPHGSLNALEAPSGLLDTPFLGDPLIPDDCIQDKVIEKSGEPHYYFAGLYSCSVLSSTGSDPINGAYAIYSNNNDEKVILGFKDDIHEVVGAPLPEPIEEPHPITGEIITIYATIAPIENPSIWFSMDDEQKEDWLRQNATTTISDHAKALRSSFLDDAERTTNAVFTANREFLTFKYGKIGMSVTSLDEGSTFNVVLLGTESKPFSPSPMVVSGDPDTRIHYATIDGDQQMDIKASRHPEVTLKEVFYRLSESGKKILDKHGNVVEGPKF